MRHSLKAEGLLMLLLDAEEEISGSTPHELGEPTPLESRRLGPP